MSEREMAANYPGDVRHIVGEVKGPDTARAFYIAVAADFDEEASRTRVTFKPYTPAMWIEDRKKAGFELADPMSVFRPGWAPTGLFGGAR